MRPAIALILAAGEGTRMISERSKVLHELFGRFLIEHVAHGVRAAGVKRLVIVAGRNLDALRSLFGREAVFARQSRRLGTGHAVMCARPALGGHAGDVLIIPGDAPLVRAATLRAFLAEHQRSGSRASVLTADLENPGSYGRIVRDDEGFVAAIREALDATPEEREIREINSGVYAVRAKELFEALGRLRPENAKKEYYLTDAVEELRRKGVQVLAVKASSAGEMLGINTRRDLAVAHEVLNARSLDYHMDRGVTVVSPRNTYIEDGTRIGKDTVIYPFTYIEKDVRIGKGCAIGPFCKIRSGSRIDDGAAVGSFVEIVRSRVGRKTNVKHLAYLGDAEVGAGVNIGAGTITANFDGRAKLKTRIGDGAFIGCDTILVAPVSIGKRARTGAGSIVLRGKNVKPGETVAGVPARPIAPRPTASKPQRLRKGALKRKAKIGKKKKRSR